MKRWPKLRSVAKSLPLLVVACLYCSQGVAQDAASPYRNAKLPVAQRVADLLSRMTLEEKVAQITSAWENRQFFTESSSLFIDEKGGFLPDHAALLLKNGLGEISRPSEGRGAGEGRNPREMAEFTN